MRRWARGGGASIRQRSTGCWDRSNGDVDAIQQGSGARMTELVVGIPWGDIDAAIRTDQREDAAR